MNGQEHPEDGTVIPAVHGDPTPTPDTTGVPVLSYPLADARGPASRAPERDAAASPLDPAADAGPGGRAAPRGYRGKAFTDAVKGAMAEQARRDRATRGRYTRIADRAAGAAYKPGGNRKGGRT